MAAKQITKRVAILLKTMQLIVLVSVLLLYPVRFHLRLISTVTQLYPIAVKTITLQFGAID